MKPTYKKCCRCEIKYPFIRKFFKVEKRKKHGLATVCKRCHVLSDSVRENKIKDSVFTLYGSKCNRCGFNDVRALQIDHVNGGGNKERILLGRNAILRIRRDIISGKRDKKKYQVLCANCNWIKKYENKEF